ncbi:MAG: hypothetical protein AAF945_12465 [Actinomycetota bacterium]
MNEHDNDPALDDGGSSAETTAAEPASTRRSFVSKGALAAAVGAAAGLAVSQRASAADGGNAIIGQANAGSNTTQFFGGTTLEGWGGNSSGDAAVYGHTGNSLGDSTRGVHGAFTGTGAGGVGVYGAHTGTGMTGVGVYGTTTDSDAGGIGVHGVTEGTTGGEGVRGESKGTKGIGVHGLSTNTQSTAVLGEATGGRSTGVAGDGTQYDIEAIGSGIIRISSAQATDITATSAGAVGSLARNSDGELWYCVATNTWRNLSSGAAPIGPAGSFTTVAPFRVFDSRFTTRFAGDENRTISCADSIDVATGATVTADALPVGANAVAANITVIGPTTNGFASINPGGDAVIKASVVNYTAGQNIANAGIFALDASRQLEAIFGPGGGGHLAIDITGYWT